MIEAKTYSYTATVAANSALSISAADFGVETVSGYVQFGIYSHNTGSDVLLARTVQPYATNDGAIIRLRNVSSAQASATVTVGILYIRRSAFTIL